MDAQLITREDEFRQKFSYLDLGDELEKIVQFISGLRKIDEEELIQDIEDEKFKTTENSREEFYNSIKNDDIRLVKEHYNK